MGPLEFALMGANSYIDDMTPIYMAGNNENTVELQWLEHLWDHEN